MSEDRDRGNLPICVQQECSPICCFVSKMKGNLPPSGSSVMQMLWRALSHLLLLSKNSCPCPGLAGHTTPLLQVRDVLMAGYL